MSNIRSFERRASTSLWLLVVAGATAACGGSGSGVVTDEPAAGSITSAIIGLRNKDFTDATGDIQIRVKVCSQTASARGLLCAYCPVDPDYALIGGGAMIDQSPASGRLKASRPSEEGTAYEENCHGDPTGDVNADVWLARSYSVGNNTHKLQAYSIGLKIPGYTAADLQYYIDYHESSTAAAQTPTLSVTPFEGFYLVGGGAELLGDSASGPSGYLTDQRPSADHTSWVSTAVFDSNTSGIIKGFGIGIRNTLPLSSGYFVTRWRTATSGSGTGYRSVSGSTPFPWAPGPIGASGVTNGASSRYLADLVPLGTNETAGFSVTTKDEGTAVSGATIGYQVNLLSYSTIAPYNYNVIRFSNFANLGFSRPSGAAPVNLQQATGAVTNAMHWYLEDRGAGKYRVRAGNPNTGTECAARDPNAAGAVRVMTCGTSNDFLFVVDYGAIDANFRLRNVANGKCIDNLSSTTTSDLAFRTCPAANVSSASTQLYLGQSNWPP